MAMTINTNLASLNAQRNLRKAESPLNDAMQRLSSGLRINSAKDDAAGLAIATRMDAQVRGLTVAIRNANDGLSFVQTAEGAITEMVSDVERIYELAVQSASYNTAQDRGSMNDEVKELISELDRVVTQTRFNGEQFLNKQVSWAYQVGTKVDETITINTMNIAPTALGVTTTYSSDFKEADVAISSWSTYKTAAEKGLPVHTTLNGTDLGGSIDFKDIENNSRTLIDRINKYTGDTSVKAMSFGNSLVAKKGVSITSEGVAAQTGFITINGVAIGSMAKVQVSDEQRAKIKADVSENAKAEVAAKAEELQQNRAKIKDEIVHRIKIGKLVRTVDQKGMTDEDLAEELTAKKVDNGAVDAVVDERVKGVVAADTAKAIAVVINDRATETGVKAFVVSSSRLVLANMTGAGINISTDESRFISKDGDATKDIDLGYDRKGATVAGGQNGLIVLSDKRFSSGTIAFDSDKTTSLFGYGLITQNGEKTNLQHKIEVGDSVNLNKKGVSDLSIDTADNAKLSMMVSEEVLDVLNSFKSTIGAKMNRIESTVRNLDNVRENITAAKSRILDADFAAETANLTKSMILQQAGMSILSQANARPQSVLALMRA